MTTDLESFGETRGTVVVTAVVVVSSIVTSISRATIITVRRDNSGLSA
jgi:hypothetical protein